MKSNKKKEGCKGIKKKERLLIKPNLRKRKNEKIILTTTYFQIDETFFHG
jgi:hypothetical protein